MKQVAESLEPGGSAIFMLVVKAPPGKAIAELSKYGGHVVQTLLSTEDEDSLKKALEPINVKEGAEDHLDLEEAESSA